MQLFLLICTLQLGIVLSLQQIKFALTISHASDSMLFVYVLQRGSPKCNEKDSAQSIMLVGCVDPLYH